MLNVLEFKAAMVRKGYTQKMLAEKLGISEKTLCERLKAQRFGTEEIEQLIPLLEISDPMAIFFDGVVTSKDTDGKEGIA
jgi:transcriptional regulator with XRE-family HTH domain